MDSWVDEAGDAVVVLLGAGASAPQLPVSKELTDLVVKCIDATYPSDDVSNLGLAWHLIRRQLEGTTGIEEFYTALFDVSNRDVDTTRFWIDRWVDFPQFVDDGAQPATAADVTVLLAHRVRTTVMEILASQTSVAEVAYLYSLVLAPLQGVISTNYDLMLERAATACGVRYSTGAALWEGGAQWFNDMHPDGALKLLKVHGSLNWRSTRVIVGGPLPVVGFEEVGGDGRGPGALLPRLDEAAIFGLGNKVRSDGAYPALVRAVDDLLAEAKLLVVIGFSFSDVHITEPIRRWAALNSEARIIVVDPYSTHSVRPQTPLGELQQALWDGSGFGDSPGMVDHGRVNRMKFIVRTAEDGIAELFGRSARSGAGAGGGSGRRPGAAQVAEGDLDIQVR